MKKTSVYLDADEVTGLKRVSARTGQSQSELIRAGVRAILEEGDLQQRAFRSMGKGHGGGEAFGHWDDHDLHADRLGRNP
jgi:Arc/MetJ-type ribon-helix-helix transcriptional regulator